MTLTEFQKEFGQRHRNMHLAMVAGKLLERLRNGDDMNTILILYPSNPAYPSYL